MFLHTCLCLAATRSLCLTRECRVPGTDRFDKNGTHKQRHLAVVSISPGANAKAAAAASERSYAAGCLAAVRVTLDVTTETCG